MLQKEKLIINDLDPVETIDRDTIHRQTWVHTLEQFLSVGIWCQLQRTTPNNENNERKVKDWGYSLCEHQKWNVATMRWRSGQWKVFHHGHV